MIQRDYYRTLEEKRKIANIALVQWVKDALEMKDVRVEQHFIIVGDGKQYMDSLTISGYKPDAPSEKSNG